MVLDDLSLLAAGGALVLGTFVVVRLLQRPRPFDDSTRLLALLIGVCALNAAHPALIRGSGFFEPLQFALPPLLAAYARAAVGRFRFRWIHLFHFLPLVAAVWFTVRREAPPAVSVVTGPSRGPWALRNLMRRPLRTLSVVATTALGVAIFSTGFNIRESLWQFLGSTSDAMRFDLQVVLAHPVASDRLQAPFQGLAGIDHTEVWTGGRGELQSRAAGTDSGVGVVALPFDTTMAAPRLVAGRWLGSALEPEVVLNQESQQQLGRVKVGDSVVLGIGGQPRTVKVVGVAEEIDKAKVYLSRDLWTLWADPARQGNTLTIVARDRTYQGVLALKKDLERAVAASDLNVLSVISQAERTKIIADHLDIILTVLLILALLVLGLVASAFFGTLVTVVVTLVFGWLANRGPALAATKVSTRKALAYE